MVESNQYSYLSQLRKYQDSYTSIIIKPNKNYEIIKIHIVICFVFHDLFDSGYFSLKINIL